MALESMIHEGEPSQAAWGVLLQFGERCFRVTLYQEDISNAGMYPRPGRADFEYTTKVLLRFRRTVHTLKQKASHRENEGLERID